MRIAIVYSRYNEEVTSGLLSGAREYLKEKGLDEGACRLIEAPGAYEIPLLAQRAASSGAFDGVICLGCLVKGDTAHFEYIAEAVSHGLMQVGLATGVPVAFGVLTTYTWEQALARSKPGAENKGREAAGACFESIQALKTL